MNAEDTYTLVSNLYKSLVDADETIRASNRAKIQGLIDGNRPYSQAKLKRLGQGYRCNVNFREAEGHINARLASYYELLTGVECLIQVKCLDKEQEDRRVYSKVIAKNFHKMLKEWKGFIYNILLNQLEMVVWGVGPIHFEDKHSFHFTSLSNSDFLVPNDSISSIDGLEKCAIRSNISAIELWQKVNLTEEDEENDVKENEKRESAKEKGWKVDAINECIKAAYEAKAERNQSDWERMQGMLREGNGLAEQELNDSIQIAHVFVKDQKGTISHYIKPLEVDCDKLLFSKKAEYDDWQDFLVLFFSNVGTGTYHSVKGMGTKIYPHCVINNRLQNTMVDGAIIDGTILVQGAEGMPQSQGMLRLGPITEIPPGYSDISGSFNPGTKSMSAVSDRINNRLRENIGTHRPNLIEEKGEQLSQKDQKLTMLREAKLEKADISIYYTHLDDLYDAIKERVFSSDYSKLDEGYEQVQKFKQRCKEQGVPASMLKADTLEISANRAMGYGSPVLANQISKDLLGIAPYLDEEGRVNAIRNYVGVLAGFDQVDRYRPVISRNNTPTQEHSIASLENNDLVEGSSPIVATDHNHVIHLIVHVPPLTEHAQIYAQQGLKASQMPPRQLVRYMQVTLEHVSAHLDYIAEDPARKPDYDKFFKIVQDIVKVFNKLKTEVENIIKQQQKEEQQRQEQLAVAEQEEEMSPDMKAQIQRQQQEHALAVKKAGNEATLKNKIAEHEMALKEIKQQQELLLKEKENEE